MKIMMFDYEPQIIGDDQIVSFDVLKYFPKKFHVGAFDLLQNGLSSRSGLRSLQSAHTVNYLYLTKNKDYMRLLDAFIEETRDVDCFVMSTYNFVHPDVWRATFRKKTKVLGFIDDPYSSYSYGQPYLWAFDAAFYISPSYSEVSLFKERIADWMGYDFPTYFLPLSTVDVPELADEELKNREIDVAYVGNAYPGKLDRLKQLKSRFNNNFALHGRWRFKGYEGYLNPIFGRPYFPYHVRSLSNSEFNSLMMNSKIGFNMHLSSSPRECGNQRTYQVPAFGALLLSDKAAFNAQNQIFEDGKEAIYYENNAQAADMIEYFIKNENERFEIARNGHKKFINNYQRRDLLAKFLCWVKSIEPR